MRSLPLVLCALAACSAIDAGPPPIGCDAGNGGITLPQGFCASVFADSVGVARHLIVVPTGDVYVALESAVKPSANVTHMRGQLGTGGIIALRDTNNDGRADLRERINSDHGSGIALRDSTLYFSTITVVMRYRLRAGTLLPMSGPDTVITGFPDTGGHSSRSLAFDDSGFLYVNIGSDSDACRNSGRGNLTGMDPCPELDHRAGIWRFDPRKPRHDYHGTVPFATGIRNAMGLAWNPRERAVFATQHGRDGLYQLWPRLYSAKKSSDTPSEALMRLHDGANFGWPYCYHDRELGRLVLAPEYGGDASVEGRCAGKDLPVYGFPGHWAPNSLLFHSGKNVPAKYANGVFVAFHGSWNRPAREQAGYLVAFLPLADGKAVGGHEIFADGFANGKLNPGGAQHRPVGIAEGPDGSIYVSDDARGRIWRIRYQQP